MGIQGNRYQLNERINELEHKLKETEKQNKELKENSGIILKNINLTGITIREQHLKIKEETKELTKAILEESDDDVISEYFDLMQVWLGYIEKVRGIKSEEFMRGYPKHIEKIKLRPRKKECNKCINCSLTTFGAVKTYQCDKNDEIIYSDDFAKSCNCYEEQEE